MKKRWSFDVPVDGFREKNMSMGEIMRAYKSCKNSDVSTAQAMLEYACACQYAPAKFELARLLINNPKVDMKQYERYARAEKILTELADNPDASDEALAAVSLEQAKLYDILNRPVGNLAMLLRTRRFRPEAVTDKDIELCKRKLSRMDISDYGENARDAYVLGMELVYAKGPFKFAEFFLREAVDTAKGELKGKACLALADLYADNPQEGRALRQEAFALYKKAAEHGYPECLSAALSRP
jgi:TPR repeat protein